MAQTSEKGRGRKCAANTPKWESSCKRTDLERSPIRHPSSPQHELGVGIQNGPFETSERDCEYQRSAAAFNS